jgi:hypothetical protein
MFTRQVPPSAIVVDAQTMAGRQMSSDHQAPPSAFQADDEITLNGSPDRHRGSSRPAVFIDGLTEADERLMNG